MGSYIIRKLGYGLLVLWGVITLVFSIFSINPGDPARMLLGQRVDEESLSAVRKELGLDLPMWKQYVLYLNDVSPVSVHKKGPEASHVYLNPEKYEFQTLLPLGNTAVVAKWPYLRR
ncbi:MAG: ABC transporter permease, partial [Cryomorphaceae bacterium]